MRKHVRADSYYEANVWPAVTDTILLMASIFIILSVVSMISLVQKYADYETPGPTGQKLVCITYEIPEGLLFHSSQYELEKAKEAVYMKELKSILERIATRVDDARSYAKQQKWTNYYLVIEAGGHADDLAMPSSMRSQADGNWELSSNRGVMVIHLLRQILKDDKRLREQLNISQGLEAAPGSTVLRAAGYSSYLPAVSYTSPGDRKRLRGQNRRVEIRMFAQSAEQLQTRVQASPKP